MQVTFLGTGNAFAPQRNWACILLDGTVLLEAAPSLLYNIKRLSLDPTRIRHIFLTHFHGDHFFGLPFLLLEYHFLSRTTEPLYLIGPAGIEARVRAIVELAYPDLVGRGWPRPLHFVEAQPGVVQSVAGLTFSAVEVDHGQESLAAYGYRLHLPDGILAYSGDTRMTETLYELIAEARVIILEASSEETSPIHLGKAALRDLLARAPADSVAFLNHLDLPGADPWADLSAIVPRDLDTYHLAFTPGTPPEVRYG